MLLKVPLQYLGSPAIFAELVCCSTRLYLMTSEGPELAEVRWETEQRWSLIQFPILGWRPLGRPPGGGGRWRRGPSCCPPLYFHIPRKCFTSRAARRQDVDIFSLCWNARAHTHILCVCVTWQWKPPAESLLSHSHGSSDVREWSGILRPFAIYYSNIYLCFSSLALRSNSSTHWGACIQWVPFELWLEYVCH